MNYYFNFTQSIGLVQIDEPFGVDKVPFVIRKDSGRKGRDVTYAGGSEAKFRITPAVDRYGFEFKQFLRDWLRYSFELQIELMIDFGDGIEVIGNVAEVTTNQYDYIDFVVVQKLAEATLKRNYDVTQDISGLNNSRVLLPAKPIVQGSKWVLAPFNYDLSSGANEFAIQDNSIYFNPIQQQELYDVQDSLTWLSNIADDAPPFLAVRAENTLRNITVRFDTNIKYKYRPNEVTGEGDKSGSLGLYIRYGQTYETATEIVVWYNGSNTESDADFQLPSIMEATIPSINATDGIWVYFRVGSQGAAVNRIQFSPEDSFTITGYSVGLTTVVECIRYIDAIDAVVDMAGQLEVVAPRFRIGGEFYNQFITSAALMRNIEQKPFYISLKDIVEDEIRPELNGDYEITADSDVFFGIYEDFYRNVECGRFEQYQFEDYLLKHDDSKAIKIIKNGFKTFASQKETEVAGTYDTVHGDAQHKTENLNASNEREAMVGFIRDAFLIAEMQRKSYESIATAATQDDRKIVALDVVSLPVGRIEGNTFFLQHIYDAANNQLILKNEGNFNWATLGIGDTFNILSGANLGSYTVLNSEPQNLYLSSGSGVDFTGNTAVSYTISSEVTLKARTNEGFQFIQNIEDGENFVNLPWTTKRILRKYFEQEISSYCLPIESDVINTEYNNNPDALTKLIGELKPIVEGETYEPVTPILEPMLVECTLAMTLAEYWEMANKIRSERGFIRTWDAEGMPIMLYLNEGSWIPPQQPNTRQGYLECVGEKKYEPFYMTIVAIGTDRIINGEPVTGFNFSIDSSGYITLYDSVGKRLYNPVPFDRVKLNNSGAADSPEQLMTWLSQFDIED